MGTINKGILGGFAGTVGTVIGGSWKGIDYMRSRPARRSGTLSPKQQAQHMKFGLGIHFVQSMSALFMVTFRNYAVRMTGTNSALSYLLKNAITGSYPSFAIDFSLVLISRGDLPNGINPTATTTAGSVDFNWVDNAGTGRARKDDKAVLVVYCPEVNLSLYSLDTIERKDTKGTVSAAIFTGKLVHTYIGFISEDGKEVATSIYTGQLTVL